MSDSETNKTEAENSEVKRQRAESRRWKFRTWGYNKKSKRRPTQPVSEEDLSKLSKGSRSISVSTHDLANSGYVEKVEETEEEKKRNEEKMLKNRAEAFKKLEELVATEESYIKDLYEMNEYIEYLENIKKRKEKDEMPKDLKIGKVRIVFANIKDLLDFHEKELLPEIEKCPNDPKQLPKLFARNRDKMKAKYGKFCINKPKSDFIHSQYEDYFSVSVNCQIEKCLIVDT